MADFYAGFSALPQYRLHAVIWQAWQDVAGNFSNVGGQEIVEKLSGSGYYTGSAGNAGQIDGDIYVGAGGWAPYDFSAYWTKLIGSGSGNVTHNPDGTKVASGSFSANDSAGGNMGAAFGYWALGLTTIPRGALDRYDGSTWKMDALDRYDGSTQKMQVLERYTGSGWARQI